MTAEALRCDPSQQRRLPRSGRRERRGRRRGGRFRVVREAGGGTRPITMASQERYRESRILEK